MVVTHQYHYNRCYYVRWLQQQKPSKDWRAIEEGSRFRFAQGYFDSSFFCGAKKKKKSSLAPCFHVYTGFVYTMKDHWPSSGCHRRSQTTLKLDYVQVTTVAYQYMIQTYMTISFNKHIPIPSPSERLFTHTHTAVQRDRQHSVMAAARATKQVVGPAMITDWSYHEYQRVKRHSSPLPLT